MLGSDSDLVTDVLDAIVKRITRYIRLSLKHSEDLKSVGLVHPGAVIGSPTDAHPGALGQPGTTTIFGSDGWVVGAWGADAQAASIRNESATVIRFIV